MLTERENTLRNYDFAGPEWIPTNVGISPATCRTQWPSRM